MYNQSDFNIDDEMIDELRDLGYELNDYSLSDSDFRDLDFDGYSTEDSGMILDVPYVPSDEKIVHSLLDLAEVTNKDTLYDLGCGDGRILVAAALERNAHGVGIDIDPMRINEAIEYAGHTGVEHLVHFAEADLMEVDISAATVVTLYLLDIVNIKLRPRLLDELQPGTRVVSHAFNMGDWKPDQQQRCGSINLYKWIIPAKVAGSWEWQTSKGETYRVELKQKYQEVTGKAWLNGEVAQLKSALLSGDLLELIVQTECARPVSFLMRCEPKQLVAAEGNLQATPALKAPKR
ncbi:class I SAM-dependent methyltransferase [Oceanisphaera sp. IT1-181]|uniref:class I SAM-dependent methyltransferase n=1 Tax=Oceanisphaera sp. IT1-181 TaxID=3081199 RepID=UPI0029CA8D17|nr:class I SAM-dependent methyltransferase [Oceanisphaera sp. IT1-181]